MTSPDKTKLGCLALAAVCEVFKQADMIPMGATEVYQYRELIADLAETAPWMLQTGRDLALRSWIKVRECTSGTINRIRQLFT